MEKVNGKAKNVRIAYIGGGSRGWARYLMSDLLLDERMSGTVALYDIDQEAVRDNAVIGNKMNELPETKSDWSFITAESLKAAVTGADFVVISILPGTFDEMEVDVHWPEKYGMYQSVGDTVGPGGVVRALRTVPMFKTIAEAVRDYAPNAWVINYTNPMTVCTRTLYAVFPKIKAFGCCHEVFGTQELIANVYNTKTGGNATRQDIEVNLYGVNHFTWVNEARYKGEDLMPMMWQYALENPDGDSFKTLNWMNKSFQSNSAIKLDLFKRYGVLAAAGDRHLCEFVPADWYMKDAATAEKWKYNLTSVAWRKQDKEEKVQETKDLAAGKKPVELKASGEEGVNQMAALAGLGSYVTNVNVPNLGQIPNLPMGAVVETNAYFSGDSVRPLYAGAIPGAINHMVIRHAYNQEEIVKCALAGDYEGAFKVFINDPQMRLPLEEARKMYDEMLYATRAYLPYYEKYAESRKS